MDKELYKYLVYQNLIKYVKVHKYNKLIYI